MTQFYDKTILPAGNVKNQSDNTKTPDMVSLYRQLHITLYIGN